MQKQDLTALISVLTNSLDQAPGTAPNGTIQQRIAPLLGADLQQNTLRPATGSSPVVPPLNDTGKTNVNTAFAFSNQLLTESPDVFKSIKNAPAASIITSPVTRKVPVAPVIRPITGITGSGILNTIQTIKAPINTGSISLPIQTVQQITVYRDTDPSNPVLILPVIVSNVRVIIPPKNTSYKIAPGSVWILSKLLCTAAPSGTYTGLTVSGGTIAFNQLLPLANKKIIMPAGDICSLVLNLQQPVDTTVPPQNIGIDALNANVKLPTQFSFNITEGGLKIQGFTDASWQLYGSSNTFQYDASQVPLYNPILNGIYLGCKVTAPKISVTKSASSYFKVRGSTPVIDGYWELPVAVIDITKVNTATGTGALAALCGIGLQANWYGLKDKWVDLRLPLLTATPGLIGVTDIFAQNRYASQHYNLWSNETTGRLSTLDLQYGDNFNLYYVSAQDGAELLSTTVSFLANVDRPVRADGSPVEVKGKNAILYQAFTPASKVFFMYDGALIAENYPPPLNSQLTEVPQEAMALTNALLTVTPTAGILVYGQLADEHSFKKAQMILSFGMYYLLPALPDPYASSIKFAGLRRTTVTGAIANVQAGQVTKKLPLNEVNTLLTGMISWPQPAAPANAPQKPDVAFSIFPLTNNTVFSSSPQDKAMAVSTLAAVNIPDPQKIWDGATSKFGYSGSAMLDVSTNADLMGVSFSTTNITARSAEKEYVISPVDYSAEANLLQILGMDLSTKGKFVRAFTVPEITWEPTINLSAPAPKVGLQDPPAGWLLFGNDGGPTQIFNNSEDTVPIAPIPVSNFIVNSYTKNMSKASPLITASLFTLPFGMRSMAFMYNDGKFPPGYKPSTLSIEPQNFDITPKGVPNVSPKIVTGGLQISAKGQVDPSSPGSSASFMGFTIQLRNLLNANGTPVNASILGPDVETIFNGQFEPPLVHKVGVPVERIDFSGYGASMFSNWQDPFASIAATSQAKFDVITGRTSLEVIQVKSLVYPWGIRVVRTITMYRTGSALIYRVDSGWRAETDGVYDFSYKDHNGTQIANPYIFHPGLVKGVYDVKNIIDNDLQPFTANWTRNAGETFIAPESQIQGPVPAGGVVEKVILQPVYFDADAQIDGVVQGADSNGRVPSKQMIGYVQLSPRGEPISPALFNQLLASQAGSLGGPVDCIVDIGKSGQKMRVTRVDVSNSVDGGGVNPVFAGTARGTVILPKDGSWSIVQHNMATNSVSAVDNNAAVPLIRIGQLLANGTSEYDAQQIRLANPADLLKAPDANTVNYGLLQNTATQKVLYQLPAYTKNAKQLQSKGNKFPLAKFADAFHLVNSTGIFPNPTDIPNMDMKDYAVNIVDQGYKLLNNLNPGKILQQVLPSPFYFVNTKDVKLYIEYNTTDQQGNAGSNLNYDLDSVAEKWISSAKNITLNVDLGPFTKMVYINGDFDSSNGIDSAFNIPELKFGPDLKPIVDILQILESLSGGDYVAVAKKALQIAMSNGGDNWEYKFHADKEIATIQFPPGYLDGPTTPLRLTAGLKVGAYFNESLSLTTDPSSLIPSAGAYFEFDGGMQIMCVSLAAATVYAVGQVVVKLSADIKTGPSLYMKFGFGVELMVGLPVVGNVSVTYMVGIEMTLSTTEIKITAYLLFKGEASLLGGIVDITITIEASGTVDRKLGGTPSTDITAQVTFAIDISIFLVININFSKSWAESRQIA
jgi:hypothetical protein